MPDRVEALLRIMQDKGEADKLEALTRNMREINENKDTIARLRQTLELNEQQARAALELIGEREVPKEQLVLKLAELATRLKKLPARVAPRDGDAPHVVELKQQANKAIGDGDWAEAEHLATAAAGAPGDSDKRVNGRHDCALLDTPRRSMPRREHAPLHSGATTLATPGGKERGSARVEKAAAAHRVARRKSERELHDWAVRRSKGASRELAGVVAAFRDALE
jgi:hypothetical protein